MLSQAQTEKLIGRDVVDSTGAKIGKVGQIYLDDNTGDPEWVTVRTGLFGKKESFVPLAGAAADDQLQVAYTKDRVTGAPSIEGDGHLEPDEESQLYRYYGETAGDSDGGADRSADVDAEHASHGVGDGVGEGVGEGVGDGDSMVRSEERVRTGTEQVQTGKARLRKYVETETVQVDVPVTREKARLETESISDGDRAASSASIGEDVQEVVLTEQRPVVQTETVPVERVRLSVDTEQDTETVSQDVRKERVEVDGVDEDKR